MTVTALGNFDGVHRGHAAILHTAVRLAAERGLTPAVWTFQPYRETCDLLTTAEERRELIRETGIASVTEASFAEMRDMSPEAFVENVLTASLDCRAAVCGEDFRFGKGAAGDASLLKRLMEARGRECVVVPPVCDEGGVISSTRIRLALEQGDAEAASDMLGRPWSLTGEVLHGRALGRTIDFPTINQVFPDGLLIPRRGVYMTYSTVNGVRYPAVTNVGVRPTLCDHRGIVCESHLLGDCGDVYGMTAVTEFVRFLRCEIDFHGDLNALSAQIRLDVETVAEVAGTTGVTRPS